MKFVSDILAKAGLVVDGVVTFNNTATGQTPAANDNSTKLATTAWVRNYVAPYSLPTASGTVLGGIKVGTGLAIDGSGVLSVTSSGSSSSFFKAEQTFTATAGQTTFTFTGGYAPGYVDVFLNGVYLSKTEYVATNGTTIVLNDACLVSDIVTVLSYSTYVIGQTPSARTTCRITATAGQTSFPCTYAVGQIDVFYNGSKLDTSEYTATDGANVILGTPALVDDKIEIVTWLVGGGIASSRTITINGVTYDLSANRTWTTLPTGGTSGQILAKASNTSYDTTWIDNYTSQVKHIVKAGVAVSKGQAVYVSSADGTNMIVSKSSNAAEFTSSKTFGLIAQDLALNGQGYVITEGLLAGLDTTGATAAGDPVWLGTDGNLLYGLANKPVAPAHLVFIGIVTRRNLNNGEIFVKVQNGFEVDELHDVLINGKADGQGLFLQTVGSVQLWRNRTIADVLGYTPANPANVLALTGGTLTGALYIGTNPATSGAGLAVGIPNDNAIRWRNAGNTANLGFYLGTDNLFHTEAGLVSQGAYTGFQYNSAGAYPAYNTYFGAIGTNFSNSNSELDIWNTVGGGFVFRKQTAASTQTALLTIASSGAATFSSSVTAGSIIVNPASGSSYITINTVGATGNSSQIYFNKAGTTYWDLGAFNMGAAGVNDFSLYNRTTSSNALTVLASSGNLGVGTISPSHRLTVQADAADMIVWRSPSYITGILGLDTNNLHGAMWLLSSGTTKVQISALSSSATYFNAGNVGIGVTSPVAKLTVKSPGEVGTYGDAFVLERSANAAKLVRIYEQSADGYLEVRTGANDIVSKLSGYGGSPTYFLSNVGLGTTTPSYNLDIQGAEAKLQLKNNSTGGGTWVMASTYSSWSAGGGKYVITSDGGSAGIKFAIDSVGNIGIGTYSPNTKLEVSGGIRYNLRSFSSSSYNGNLSGNLNAAYTKNYLLVCDLNNAAGFSLSGQMNAASYTCWNMSSFWIMKNYSSTNGSAGITGMYKNGCDMNIVDLNYAGGRYIAIGYTSNPEINGSWIGYRVNHMLNADGSAIVVPDTSVSINATYATY